MSGYAATRSSETAANGRYLVGSPLSAMSEQSNADHSGYDPSVLVLLQPHSLYQDGKWQV